MDGRLWFRCNCFLNLSISSKGLSSEQHTNNTEQDTQSLSTFYLSFCRIEGSSMSLSSKRSMTDADGQQVAGYQKKLLSMHATAYITVQDGGRTLVVATIKKQSAFQLESSADVYIHNPPVNIDDVTTNGLVPTIHVEGDIVSKKYDFMMGDLRTNPYKIAQVVRKFKMVMENNSYFLHMGTNIDVAFITMCAFAIDELFSDDK